MSFNESVDFSKEKETDHEIRSKEDFVSALSER